MGYTEEMVKKIREMGEEEVYEEDIVISAITVLLNVYYDRINTITEWIKGLCKRIDILENIIVELINNIDDPAKKRKIKNMLNRTNDLQINKMINLQKDWKE